MTRQLRSNGLGRSLPMALLVLLVVISNILGWTFALASYDEDRVTNQVRVETKTLKEAMDNLASYRFDFQISYEGVFERAANACVYGNRWSDVDKFCSRFLDPGDLNGWASAIVQLAGEGKSYRCEPWSSKE